MTNEVLLSHQVVIWCNYVAGDVVLPEFPPTESVLVLEEVPGEDLAIGASILVVVCRVPHNWCVDTQD